MNMRREVARRCGSPRGTVSSSCLVRDSVRLGDAPAPRGCRPRISSRASRRQRLVDAAGHHPRRVDALAGQPLDDLLAELPQPDAVARELRVGRDHAEDVARGRVGVHAEQQVGRGQVEEAQRVRLHDLREVEDAAQVGRRLRDAHGQDGVARLGRGDQVAHRADAADARHQRRHLVERPPFAELLEAAELRDVELARPPRGPARPGGW